ncbi:MAG TPA: histidine phosphatase family protein [Candidatus Binatia bacterium]|jgi:probable phosphoglycerate mutase|nr:histidine phosphatase family protein [Candidatus Binatia bacterium]
MTAHATQLVLVRHGETEWSRLGRHTGRTDLPLVEDGKTQARRLEPVLSRRTFAKVFTSPLRRARETCDLAGLGERAEVRAELAEWDYGDFEGLTHPEIDARQPGWDLWRDGCPGGESPDDVAARVDRIIVEVRGIVGAPGWQPSAGVVAVFAHGHVLRALGARWVGLSPHDGGVFDLGTATVSTLGVDGARPVVMTWNDGHHLAAS